MFKTMFPYFENSTLTYLDSAATTHKFFSVIETIRKLYTTDYAPVHRSSYKEACDFTDRYEDSRRIVAEFINADIDEVFFVSGTTDALNYMAFALQNQYDTVYHSELEHESNLQPWHGFYSVKTFTNENVGHNAIITAPHVTNTTGMINPIKKWAKTVHQAGGVLVVDGAQGIAHQTVDVKDLDCDAYAFSGHKIYGPMGIGVLYIKRSLQANLIPYRVGGGNDIFEAGTPNAIGAIGLAEALKTINRIGLDTVLTYEHSLFKQLKYAMVQVNRLKIYGYAECGAISFSLPNWHPLDIAEKLGEQGIAIRAGQHCSPQAMNSLGCESTARVSIGMYNTVADINTFVQALEKLSVR